MGVQAMIELGLHSARRARLERVSLSILAITCLILSQSAGAADGDLDPSFGAGGKTITDFGSQGDQAFAVAIQVDGKIVVGGKATTASGDDFALARYTSEGVLDIAAFGSGTGKVTTDFNGGND